jgi:lysophospholipase
MQLRVVNFLLSIVFGIAVAAPSFALPETSIRTALSSTLLPFLATGQSFTFQTTDGMKLAAIKFIHPNSTKTIVMVNGRTESFTKYAELFYDLYQKGYSIYSYDHRGQGLSPHLSTVNPEIGYVDSFHSYLEDLNTFVSTVVVPEEKPGDTLYLLAHSMGGAIAAGYLSEYKVPFVKAVLSAPMLQINTKPYPEPVGYAIVDLLTRLGHGQSYAPGYHDYDVNQPFSTNTTTGSEDRWWMTNEIYKAFPTTILGGPSNRWVLENLRATHWIRREMGGIEIPFLMFQSEKDQIVKPAGENIGCANASSLCTKIVMPDSQHEVLMERDSIRDKAMSVILEYFQ